jgi:hypothetical protein
MIDNLDLRLKCSEAGGIDFLNEIPRYIDCPHTAKYENGTVITGTLGNVIDSKYFQITINENSVGIKNGSLCKFHLGDNFKTLGRSDIQKAIENISDTLHLPIEKADVYRLDVAQNFIVKSPIDIYFNHLGELKYSRRVLQESRLYYYQSKGATVFYDKVKERRAKGDTIPELYQNRNVLRIEQRHTSRLRQIFKVENLTAAMLYSEKFYMELLNRWHDNYRAIKKINDISLNFENMKGKKDLYTIGLLSLVEKQGGELAMLEQIKEAQKSGKIDKKTAFDIKQAIITACQSKIGITAQNEAIIELDKKVNEAVKYYR